MGRPRAFSAARGSEWRPCDGSGFACWETPRHVRPPMFNQVPRLNQLRDGTNIDKRRMAKLTFARSKPVRIIFGTLDDLV
jgi:hypothetical protein